MSLEAAEQPGRFSGGELEETILLVDDDAALLEVTSIVLASEGYRVLTAEDGIEAGGALPNVTVVNEDG